MQSIWLLWDGIERIKVIERWCEQNEFLMCSIRESRIFYLLLAIMGEFFVDSILLLVRSLIFTRIMVLIRIVLFW